MSRHYYLVSNKQQSSITGECNPSREPGIPVYWEKHWGVLKGRDGVWNLKQFVTYFTIVKLGFRELNLTSVSLQDKGERAKTKSQHKVTGEVNKLWKSTLRVPVGQSGWEWYQCSGLVLGYVVVSRNLSIYNWTTKKFFLYRQPYLLGYIDRGPYFFYY